MTDNSLAERVTRIILLSLEETFEQAHSMYLDEGTTIFETLSTIDAQEASTPISPTCATLAAHVEHMTFYLDVIVQYIEGEPPQGLDWEEIWQRVSSVTEAEWQASQDKLRQVYQKTRQAIENCSWENNHQLEGALGAVVHNAYHLGEIRHALCTLKAS